MRKRIISYLVISALCPIAFGQNWSTSGNVINQTTDYLGTSTAQHLIIKTNAVDRLKIKDNGDFRFGFGYNLTNPVYSFTASERENFTVTDYTSLHQVGSFPPPYDIFKVQMYNVQTAQVGGSPPTPTSYFKVDHKGFVGIGLDKPQAKLHVHNGYIQVSGNNTSGGPMIVLGGNVNAPSGDWGMEYAPSTSVPTLKGLNFWKPSGSNNAGNYFLFLADNGNVGIGTDNPGKFKLAVEGKIGAREILVTTASPWPDYVFESNYKRTSLEEVEKYIREHKHLPGISSAQEIQENGGVNLGEMQLKQMEKIEELYLHMIDLQKENHELREMVLELQKK